MLTLNQAINLVPLIVKDFGQVLTVLAGDAGN
jgi:hypothetical protein